MSRLILLQRRLFRVRPIAGGGGGGGGGAPTHGIDINETNTGHRGTPTPSGIPGGLYTLDQAFLNDFNGGSSTFTNKTLAGVEFSGAQPGLAVSFEDCVLDGCAFQLIPNGATGNGLIWFNYCTIFGTADPYNNSNDFSWSQYAFCNAHNMKFTFCDVEGFGSGMLTAGDSFTVEDTYLHDPAPYQSEANGGPPGGTHHGLLTIQFNTCSDVVLRRVHMKAVRGTTSAFNWDGVSAGLTMYNDSSHPGPITVQDCYMAGGGVLHSYWGAVTGKSGSYATNVSATGNIFGREFLRYCGDSWAVGSGDFNDPNNTWSNNTWGALGVAPGTDPAEGTLISAPTPG